jgi:hypothetical protein
MLRALRVRVSGLLCALVLLIAPGAYAQLSSASVTGLVRDSSGSIIPNVKIVLRNVGTSVERTTTSNSAGNYVFLNITPGTYSLEASASGFQTTQISSLVLDVNQTATLDVTMQVGTLQQTVSVEAAGELVQAATSELGAVVSTKQVLDLPLNGRNFTQLLSLTPGVVPISVAQNAGSGFGNVASGTAFEFPSINGQTNRSNFFMTDGLNNQGAFSGTYAVPPIIDSIQEFKVNSHNDQAEFGGALGGIINVASKSGTNELHGTLWEYVRNDAFNARNTFQNSVTVFRQNQYGVSAGGPVVFPKLYNGKNKTFFFGAWEGFQYSRAANSFLHLPTDAELSGNLAGQVQAYDPLTTRPDPNNPGNLIRDPFSGNQIPASRIDTRLVSFAKTIRPPLFNTGVANNNAIDNTPFRQHQNEYTARIDQNVGAKDFFWFRYSSIYYDTLGSGGLPGVINTITDNPGQDYGASWVHTFSPGLILQAQYGRAHQETNSFTTYSNLSAGTVSGLGFDPNFYSNFIGGLSVVPAIAISGYSNPIPGANRSLNPNETNVHQWKANVSKVWGSHTLRFGGEVNSSTFESLYTSANSSYAFQQTSLNGTGNGNAMASFLLNVPDSAGRRNVHETTRWGGVTGYYFSDSWKVMPRLTINIGLRYDRTFIPPYGQENTVGQNGGIEAGSINFNNGTYIVQKLPPSCTSRGHAPCIPGDGTLPAHVVVSDTGKIYHDTTTNWGPRLGLAYRVSNTLAVRAGFGIFYDNWAAVTQTSQNYEGTWPDIGQQLANNLNVPVPGALLPTVTGQNPFAAGGGAFPAPTPFQQVQWYMDPYAKNPYSMQWNFGVAKELNNSTAVTVDYAASGSRRLDVGGYYNVALTPGPGDPTARQPYTYIHPTYYDRSIGRGNYNALQFQFNKRFSGGLAYQVAYTYSKSIDIGSSGWYGVEGQSVQDPYHYNNDRSVSGFDLTHVLSINVLYELPFGKGKKFSSGSGFVDYIIGGWQVNAIGFARSGQPYNVTVSGDGANTGNTGYLRASLVGDPNISNPNSARWFNTAAFASPAPFTFGNLGRYALRGSAFWNVDASIFREFKFLETRALEFRAESFNTPNTVIMGNPNSNVSNPAQFGTVTGTANSPRSLQLGLKVRF